MIKIAFTNEWGGEYYLGMLMKADFDYYMLCDLCEASFNTPQNLASALNEIELGLIKDWAVNKDDHSNGYVRLKSASTKKYLVLVK